MALPWLRRQQTLDTLRYFDEYDYPLTREELEYWSGITPRLSRKYYFLPGRSRLVKLRQQRAKFSQAKWQIAREVGEKLKKLPSIAAVFVTGALAMNNCPEDDDIDLMIITHPNTLWITRLFLNLYLDWHSLRRHPGQTTAPDKICPNLWLDLNHLAIQRNLGLYTAHEILQAQVLWDRAGVHYQLLKQNSWVSDYLPIAYKSQTPNPKSQINPKSQFSTLNYIFAFFNLFFYLAQYLYMKPKMTTEKVGPGYAFFHPATSS